MSGNRVKANLRRRKIKAFVSQVLANKMALFGTVVLRSVRALLVRLGRAAGRPARTPSGEHESHAGGCHGC